MKGEYDNLNQPKIQWYVELIFVPIVLKTSNWLKVVIFLL